MASTYASTPYRGQSQSLPSGYMQAATSPGRSIAAGIQQAGDAIGEGLRDAIAGYRQSEKDRATRKAAHESLVERVINSRTGIKDQAESGDDRAAELVSRSSKFGDLSAAQQKQLIADITLYDADQKQAKQDGMKAGFDLLKMQQMAKAIEMDQAALDDRDVLAAERKKQQKLAEAKRFDENAMAKTDLANFRLPTSREVPQNFTRQATPEEIGAARRIYSGEAEGRMREGFRKYFDALNPQQGQSVQPSPEFMSGQYTVQEVVTPTRENLTSTQRARLDAKTARFYADALKEYKGIEQDAKAKAERYASEVNDYVSRARKSDRDFTYTTTSGSVGGASAIPIKKSELQLAEEKADDNAVDLNLRAYLQKLSKQKRAAQERLNSSTKPTIEMAREKARDELFGSRRQEYPAPAEAQSTQAAPRPAPELPQVGDRRMVDTPFTEAEMQTRKIQNALKMMEGASPAAKVQQIAKIQAEYKNKLQVQPVDGIGTFVRFPDGKYQLIEQETSELKPLDQSGVEMAMALQSGEEDLGKIFEVFSNVDSGPIAGRLSGLNPYNVELATLNSLVDQAVPNFARGVFGEVGVLTDADMSRYRSLLPEAATPQNVGQALRQVLSEKLDRSKKNFIETYEAAGRDVGKMRELFKKGGQPQAGKQRLKFNSVKGIAE